MSIVVTLVSERKKLAGFMYFWAKRVRGFRPGVHCAQCLVGDYVDALGKDNLVAGKPVSIALSDAERSLYVCGVASPYVWRNNFHAALVPFPCGEPFVMPMHNGDELHIEGAALVGIHDEHARAFYPDKSEAFLTCRNFQYGAQTFLP